MTSNTNIGASIALHQNTFKKLETISTLNILLYDVMHVIILSHFVRTVYTILVLKYFSHRLRFLKEDQIQTLAHKTNTFFFIILFQLCIRLLACGILSVYSLVEILSFNYSKNGGKTFSFQLQIFNRYFLTRGGAFRSDRGFKGRGFETALVKTSVKR